MDRTRALLLTFMSLTSFVLGVLLACDRFSSSSSRAGDWFGAAGLLTFSSTLLIIGAAVDSRPQWQLRLWATSTAALFLGGTAFAFFGFTWGYWRGGTNTAIWLAGGTLLVGGGIAAVLGSVILGGTEAPRAGGGHRMRRRSASSDAGNTLSEWDMRQLFRSLRHWGEPEEDSPPDRGVLVREIRESEVVALARAALHLRTARFWQRLQYAIGIPATVFAGAAGATGVADVGGTLGLVIGILGLIGSSLTGVVTTLNAGRKSQEHSTTSARFEAIAREAHVVAAVGADDVETLRSKLDNFVRQLNGLGVLDPAASTLEAR